MLTERTYCPDRYAYRRRRAREVGIGTIAIGGAQPIRVQSMTTTRTQDIVATFAQAVRLVDAGCEIVRITAPTVNDARAIGEIRRQLRARGITGGGHTLQSSGGYGGGRARREGAHQPR